MASPSTSPDPEIPQFETVFVVNLNTYTKNLTENNGKTKVKEVKFIVPIFECPNLQIYVLSSFAASVRLRRIQEIGTRGRERSKHKSSTDQ
jgi:hypothetical protein